MGGLRLQAGNDALVDSHGQLPLQRGAPLLEEGDQSAGPRPQALGPGDGFGQVRRLFPLTDGAELRFGDGHLTVEVAEGGAQVGLRPTQLPSGMPGRGQAGLDGAELPAGQMPPEGLELVHEVAVPAGRVSLLLEGSQLAADFAEQVLQTLQAALGRLEAPLRLLLAAPVLEDAGGLLDHEPAVLGPGVEDGVQVALRHDDVLLAADTGVGEELLDVEESAGHTVDGVLRLAAAKQRPGDGDLGELDGHQAGAVVDREGHLSPPERGALGGAGEDDILHLGGADRPRRLRSEHPGDGVDDVGLAAAVGPDDDSHPGLEFEGGGIGKGLESLDGQRFQKHGDFRDTVTSGTRCTKASGAPPPNRAPSALVGRAPAAGGAVPGEPGYDGRWQRGQYQELRP